MDQVTGCPKCKSTEVYRDKKGSWRFDTVYSGLAGPIIAFCPFCGQALTFSFPEFITKQEELAELAQKYLGTLDDTEKYELFLTERGFASIGLESYDRHNGFLDFLKEKSAPAPKQG